MKTSGIIYHSEWESDEESVSFREEVVVSSFETKDENYFDRNTTQDTIAAIPSRSEVEDHPAVLRESVSVYDTPSPRATKSDSSRQKRDRKLKRPSLIDSNTFRPGAKIALPKRKRFKPMRKLFGLLLLFPKKFLGIMKSPPARRLGVSSPVAVLLRLRRSGASSPRTEARGFRLAADGIKARRVLGFPFRVTGRALKKTSKTLIRISRALKLGKVPRAFGKVFGKTTRGVLKSAKIPVEVLKILKVREIFRLLKRTFFGVFNNAMKTLRQFLKVFRIFKVVNRKRTSKVLKTSSKYSKKSGKALFKGTKWLTIKTVKLIPPTVSLTYRGAKKIKSNDILFRLVVAAIAGIIFFATIFTRY